MANSRALPQRTTIAARIRRRVLGAKIREKSWVTDPKAWFSLLLGLVGFLQFNAVGTLGASDILVILAIPFTVQSSRKYFKNSVAGLQLKLAGLYFAGLVISDLWRQTEPEDYVRGWAKVGILVITLWIVPGLLEGKASRMGIFIIGYWIATSTQFVFGFNFEPYKAFLAFPLTGIAFYIAGNLKPKMGKWAFIFPIGVGCLSFIMDARSAAGSAFLTTTILLFNDRIPERILSSPREMKLRSGKIAAAVLVSATVIISVYQWGASSGTFGEKSQAKYELQEGKSGQQATVFDIMLGGRTESQFSIPKIVESPIIGQGSWAKDPDYVHERRAELGMDKNDEKTGSGLIPSHSHFFGGWLEAGIFGGVFWGFAVFLSLQVLLFAKYKYGKNWEMVFCFASCGFLWDVLFSPFGGIQKVHEGIILGIIAFLVRSPKTQRAVNTLQDQYRSSRHKQMGRRIGTGS